VARETYRQQQVRLLRRRQERRQHHLQERTHLRERGPNHPQERPRTRTQTRTRSRPRSTQRRARASWATGSYSMMRTSYQLDMEEEPSSEASSGEAPASTSGAPRSFHFKRRPAGAPSQPDITDDLLNLDLLAPCDQRAASGAPMPSQPSATAAGTYTAAATAARPSPCGESHVGCDSMSAKQSASSRVAAGIVTPDQYRGTTHTAQIAPADQMETEAAPVPAPETAHNPCGRCRRRRQPAEPQLRCGRPAPPWPSAYRS
jgi:hypothetical protein